MEKLGYIPSKNLIMLTKEEKDRYNRHIILPAVGEQGQYKLKNAKVLVVGAGGLGSPVLTYLTAAGIGTIGIVDDDVVSLSNLQRQILYSTEQIGKSKIEHAKTRLSGLNPNTKFKIFNTRFSTENGAEILNDFDILVDCTDNFEARYHIDRICLLQKKPMVHASIYKFSGQISVFHYKNAGSYKDLFPTEPKVNEDDESRLGVIGILPGIIGCMQANEVIKIITGAGNVLAGKLLIYDALKPDMQIINITENYTKNG